MERGAAEILELGTRDGSVGANAEGGWLQDMAGEATRGSRLFRGVRRARGSDVRRVRPKGIVGPSSLGRAVSMNARTGRIR